MCCECLPPSAVALPIMLCAMRSFSVKHLLLWLRGAKPTRTPSCSLAHLHPRLLASLPHPPTNAASNPAPNFRHHGSWPHQRPVSFFSVKMALGNHARTCSVSASSLVTRWNCCSPMFAHTVEPAGLTCQHLASERVCESTVRDRGKEGGEDRTKAGGTGTSGPTIGRAIQRVHQHNKSLEVSVPPPSAQLLAPPEPSPPS